MESLEIQVRIQSYDDVLEEDDMNAWINVDFCYEKNETSADNKPYYLFWNKNYNKSFILGETVVVWYTELQVRQRSRRINENSKRKGSSQRLAAASWHHLVDGSWKLDEPNLQNLNSSLIFSEVGLLPDAK